MLNCPACGQPIPVGGPVPEGSLVCPNCGARFAVIQQVTASERGVAALGDINAPVITGDVNAPLTIEYVSLPAIPAPPPADRPPISADFVARDGELAAFSSMLADHHLVAITGMAGVGKTSLAAELARRAAAPELVFWHTFHADEGIDALLWDLAAFLAWHEQPELWVMLNRVWQGAARQMAREVIFSYLLQNLRGRGFLLCLDDLHHVADDPLFASLLRELLPAVEKGELSLLITARGAPGFLAEGQLSELGGLDLAGAARLAAVRGLDLAPELLESVWQQTGGNAQLLTLAIQALQNSRDPAGLVENLSNARDIERFLLREVDQGLSDAERGVLSAAAVLLGYAGTRESLEALLESNVRRALFALTENHLLAASEGRAGLQYRLHAILQEFYYDLLSPAERRAMHLSAGDFYAAREPDPFLAALHYERAGALDKALAFATADAAAMLNQGRARELSRLLERFPREQVSAAQWAALSLARGETLAFLGEAAQAREAYHSALEGLDAYPASPLEKARAFYSMAVFLEFEDPQAALEWLRRGLDALGPAPDSPAEDEKELRAALLIRLGGVQMQVGRYEDAAQALQAGLPLLGGERGLLWVTATRCLGEIAFNQGDLERAKDLGGRALSASRSLDNPFETANNLLDLGVYRFTSDDWAGGIAAFEEALRLSRQLGSRKQVASLMLNLGAAYLNLGDDAAARERLQESLALAQASSLTIVSVLALCRLAELHLLGGELRQAVDLLDQAAQSAAAIDFQAGMIRVHHDRAEAAILEGKPAQALVSAGQAIDLARALGEDLQAGEALRVRGKALLASGDVTGAVAALRESLAALEDQETYEAACTRLELGLALRASGEPETAAAELRQAETVFQTLGARRDLARAAQILSSLPGVSPQAR